MLKKISPLFRMVLLLWIGVCSISTCKAQLSGKYTLGGASSYRNFSNWYTFVDSFNKLGVSDTLWVDVQRDFKDTNPLVFRKHKSFPSGAKKPVFINGNSHSLQISRWFESVFIDSTDNIVFKKVTLINNSQDEPICIRIGPNSDFIVLDSCNFQINGLTKIPFLYYGPGYNGYYYGSASCYIAIAHKIQNNLVHCFNQNQARAIRITHCKMETKNTNSPGPARGILSRAWPMPEFSGTTNYYIADNVISNFCYSGIEIYYSVDDTIINNDISKVSASTNSPCVSEIHGIDVQNGISNNSGLLVANNRIHDIPFKLSTSGGTPGSLYTFRGLVLTNQTNRNKNIFRSYYIDNKIDNIRSNSYFLGYWIYLDANELARNSISDVSAINFTGFLIDNSLNSQVTHNKISRVEMNPSKPGYFRGFNINGYFTTKGDSIRCLYNSIDSNTANGDFFGFYQHNYSPSIDSFQIKYISNSIRNNGYKQLNSGNNFYGFYFSDTANMSSYFTLLGSNLIANNFNASKVYMVFDSTRILDTVNYMRLQQNTFYHHAGSATVPIYGYRSRVAGNHVLIGNIFDFSTAGNVYPIQINAIRRFAVFKNNNYFIQSKSSGWSLASLNYTSFSTWKSSGKCDTSELYLNSNFVNASKSNFQTSAKQLQNCVPTITQVTKDLYGNKRSKIYSDIGAIESQSFDLSMSWAGFTRLDSACPGSTVEIKIRVKNSSIDTLPINTIAVADGVTISKQSLNQRILPKDSVQVVLKGTWKLNRSGWNILRVYLDNFDDNSANDTQTLKIWVNIPPNAFELLPDSSSSTGLNKPIYSKNPLLPDTTAINLPVYYSLKPTSSKFDNTNYGISWKATAWAVDNIGQKVTGLKQTLPTTTKSASFQFQTADSSLEGNTITIWIKVEDLKTGCDSIFTRSIYIASVPRLILAFKDTLCVGQTLNIKNQAFGGSGSYLNRWYISNDLGTLVDSSFSSNPTFLAKSRGQFYLIWWLIDTKFGFKFNKIDTFWVGQTPKIQFSISKACSGKITQIANQTIPRKSIFTWKYSDPSVRFDSAIADSLFNYKNGNSGSYRWFVTASDWGCWDTMSKTVLVNESPTAGFSVDSLLCSANTTKFSNRTNWKNQLGTYTWYFGELNKISRDTNPTYLYKTLGTKTVVLIAKTNMGCLDSAVKVIQVNQSPITCDFIYTPDYAFAYYGMRFTPADALGKPAGQPTEIYTWTVNGKDTQRSYAPNYSVSMDMTRDGTLGIGMTSVTKGSNCSCYLYKLVVMNRANTNRTILSNNEIYWYWTATGQVAIRLVSAESISVSNPWLPRAIYSTTGALILDKLSYTTVNNEIDISVDGLKSGVYYLKLTNNWGNSRILKLVIP